MRSPFVLRFFLEGRDASAPHVCALTKAFENPVVL